MRFAWCLFALFRGRVQASEVCRRDESVASMLCQPDGAPPRVAVCISGAARTFENPIVHRSLKEHLIDSLGAQTTVFAHLKLTDARGDNRTGHNGVIHGTVEGVRRAAERVGVATLEIVTERFVTPPECPNYRTQFISDAAAEKCGPDCFVNTEAKYQSVLGQLTNHKTCFEMLEKHEKEHRVAFGWVIYARPDLTWWKAVAPWCRHALPKRHRDFSFWFPRDRAKELLYDPHAAHYACKAPPRENELVEAFFVHNSNLHGLRSDVPATRSIPVVLTRQPGPNYPYICKMVGHAGGDREGPFDCHRTITGNACNRK